MSSVKWTAEEDHLLRLLRATNTIPEIENENVFYSSTKGFLDYNQGKNMNDLMTMLGFALAAISMLLAFGFFVAKLLYWNSFELGLAPLLIGIFFFGAVQMFFIGLLGEYIGSIHTQTRKMPLVVELERVNFD